MDILTVLGSSVSASREGYAPVAFVFTGKTAAQRASRMQRLEHAARTYFAGTPYPGRGAASRPSTTTRRCPR
ncbi:hypothetical protein AB0451_36010 [Streptomyces sp. NPDC052000]|uniref:hypothetical protein n=1 Tax=Streptomyces sp. NPDC052000 TaxID=3155676 RepID=UPI00344C8053